MYYNCTAYLLYLNLLPLLKLNISLQQPLLSFFFNDTAACSERRALGILKFAHLVGLAVPCHISPPSLCIDSAAQSTNRTFLLID